MIQEAAAYKIHKVSVKKDEWKCEYGKTATVQAYNFGRISNASLKRTTSTMVCSIGQLEVYNRQ